MKYAEAWRVNKALREPFTKQLVENIRWSISTGRIRRGEKLPPLRDLAQELGLGMHTVRNAYKQLEEEGFLRTRPHYGTIVLGGVTEKPELERQLEVAIKNALHSSLSAQEVKGVFDRVYEEFCTRRQGKRVLFVDDSQKLIDRYGAQIARETGAQVEGTLLKDLADFLKEHHESMQQYDAIIATYFHFSQVRKLADVYLPLVCGMVLEPTTEINAAVESLPTGAVLGLVHRGGDYVSAMHNLVGALRPDLRLMSASTEDSDALKTLWAGSDLVLAAPTVDKSEMPQQPNVPVYEMTECINSQSMNMLKEYLK